MELSNLKEIGLTEGEIRIYAALLDLGDCTRTQLAKKSGVSPSKIYDVVNRLVEKGIASVVKKDGVIHFSPANPERLMDFLKKKGSDLEKEVRIIQNLMPLLLMKYKNKEESTDIEVFYGWDGMKTVYNEIAKTLTVGDTNYVFGASLGQDVKQSGIFFSQYAKKVKKSGFKIKVIFNENVRGHAERESFYTSPPNEARYLYQDTFAEINLYNNFVLFVMLLKRPIIIRVRNKDAVDSFKKFFDTMWKQAKK